MKKIFQALLLLSFPLYAKPQVKDYVYGSVANEVILFSDVASYVLAVTGGQVTLLPDGTTNSTQVTPSQIETITTRLIESKILRQKAIELALEVDSQELQLEIESYAKSQGLEWKDFIEKLIESGENIESFKIRFKENMESQRIINQWIKPKIAVTEEEISNYIQNKSKTNSSLLRLQNAILSLTTFQEKEQEEIQKILPQIKESIQKNPQQSLEDILKFFPKNIVSQISTGELPPRELNTLPEELQKQLETLPPSQALLLPVVIGETIFFFNYLGMQSSQEISSSEKEQIKQTLAEAKFQQEYMRFIESEKLKLGIKVYGFRK